MIHKSNEWHEILNRKDIDDLSEAYGGFHDSCIVSANFTSGTHVDSQRTMRFDGFHQFTLSLVFYSQWSDYAMELHFAGLRRLHLVGLQGDIFDASIRFYDDLLPPTSLGTPARVVVWADSADFNAKNIDSQLTEPADTYVIAHSLKWRLIEK